jgi:hypothetical protein
MSPDETSIGAAPQYEAKADADRNLLTAPERARIFAAVTSPMPCRPVKVVPDAATAADNAAVARVIRPSSRRTSLSRSAATWHRVRADGPGPDAAQRSGCGVGGQAAGQAGGKELGEQGVQPADGLGPGADHVVAVLGQGTQGRGGEGLQARIDRDSGPGRLAGIDRDDDWRRCGQGGGHGFS